jgi:alanyl-tRNA synthetase
MTERLYYNDSYLIDFEAQVVEADDEGRRVYLDRTAFYPASGGQPHDLGRLNDVPVVEIVDEGDRIAHLLAAPLLAEHARGQVDWQRRFDFMQQHTGQHLLSAVFEARFGFKTLSVHFGAETSTVDLETPQITAAQLVEVEAEANRQIALNHPVTVGYEHASAADGLRKPSEREGELRIVSIDGLDRSACGGTHVRTTGEIGCILLRKLDKIRGSVRVEFVCGLRAARRARADFDALSAAARVFSSTIDDVPALAATLQEQAREADKTRRRLASEIAGYKGRELYTQAAVSPGGRRVHFAEFTALDDDVRALCNSFTSQPNAAFVASCSQPPALMLVVSEDSGLHAGNVMKERLAVAGGRGGGNVRMAQGSLPSAEALAAILAELKSYL